MAIMLTGSLHTGHSRKSAVILTPDLLVPLLFFCTEHSVC